jgi:hypothetical protein
MIGYTWPPAAETIVRYSENSALFDDNDGDDGDDDDDDNNNDNNRFHSVLYSLSKVT